MARQKVDKTNDRRKAARQADMEGRTVRQKVTGRMTDGRHADRKAKDRKYTKRTDGRQADRQTER